MYFLEKKSFFVNLSSAGPHSFLFPAWKKIMICTRYALSPVSYNFVAGHQWFDVFKLCNLPLIKHLFLFSPLRMKGCHGGDEHYSVSNHRMASGSTICGINSPTTDYGTGLLFLSCCMYNLLFWLFFPPPFCHRGIVCHASILNST